jgi:hypothetical protein
VSASLIFERNGHEQPFSPRRQCARQGAGLHRLECGLLGAMFCAVSIGFLVVVRSVIG